LESVKCGISESAGHLIDCVYSAATVTATDDLHSQVILTDEEGVGELGIFISFSSDSISALFLLKTLP
jgi:hypothetical protein